LYASMLIIFLMQKTQSLGCKLRFFFLNFQTKDFICTEFNQPVSFFGNLKNFTCFGYDQNAFTLTIFLTQKRQSLEFKFGQGLANREKKFIQKTLNIKQ
jgi:hypothetical protein